MPGTDLPSDGASEDEVIQTVEGGERFPAKLGRFGFRRNFPIAETWRGKVYSTKQIEAMPSLKTTAGW